MLQKNYLKEHYEMAQGEYLEFSSTEIYYPEFAIRIPDYKKQSDFEYYNVLCVLAIRNESMRLNVNSYKFCDYLNKEILTELDYKDKASIAYIFLKNHESIIKNIENNLNNKS